jgi:hypothetical protein
MFALISALDLGLMICSKSNTEFIPIWQPMLGAHWFGVYAMMTMLRLGFQKSESKPSLNTPGWNILGIALGTLAYGLVFTFHQQITGMIIPI